MSAERGSEREGWRGTAPAGGPGRQRMPAPDRVAGERAARLGTVGYLACGLGSLAAAVLAQGWRAALALALAVTLALIFYPGALRGLRRRRFWFFSALLVASSAFLVAEEGTSWQELVPSAGGLRLGAQMVLRAATILVAVGGILERVGVAHLAALAERLGLRGLGFAFGVALNSLPVIGETARNAVAALRLRGGFRRQRFWAVRQLLLTIVTNSLRYGDQVVAAAEARAYSPEGARVMPLAWSWVDLAVVGGMSVAVVALRLL